MRIAILAPVWFPVPPTGYGGIEWVVSLLADGLVDAGHDVTLFAAGESKTKAKLVSVYAHAPSEWIGNSFWELRHALACFERASDFDVINDHSGPVSATIGHAVATPVVHTVHGPLDGEPGELYEQVCRVAITGVPQAIDSIMTSPKGSSHSIGNRVARAFWSRSTFSPCETSPR